MRIREQTANKTKEIALKKALSGLFNDQRGGQCDWNRLSEVESVSRWR